MNRSPEQTLEICLISISDWITLHSRLLPFLKMDTFKWSKAALFESKICSNLIVSAWLGDL
jgi:hypothetical protein